MPANAKTLREERLRKSKQLHAKQLQRTTDLEGQSVPAEITMLHTDGGWMTGIRVPI